MTLKEISEKVDSLNYAEENIRLAMKKFEGTNNIENYLGYHTLNIALECIKESKERFINKDWQ